MNLALHKLLCVLSLQSLQAAMSLCFDLIDLKDVTYTMLPESCKPEVDFLVLIHSAPANFELRKAVRETWTAEAKAVFLMGQSDRFQDKVLEEHEKFNDIVQATFQDSYRNMTYKHILGYIWTKENCGEVQYVLKSDDDQAVDIEHLRQYFLKNYIHSEELFYLCHFLMGEKPRRDPKNKWFVSNEEFQENVYPDYCAGWAYVTNIQTVASIIGI